MSQTTMARGVAHAVDRIAGTDWRIWWLGLAILQVVDVLSTAYLVTVFSAVTYEGNPLGSVIWVHGGTLGLFVLKAAGLAFIAWIQWRFEPGMGRRLRTAWRLLLLGFSSAVVANNVVWVIRLVWLHH